MRYKQTVRPKAEERDRFTDQPSEEGSFADRGLRVSCVQYEEDSAPALALQATIDKTNKRFEFYAKNNLLCGTDGLPHLIADPGYAFKYGHAGEIMVGSTSSVCF